MNTINGKKLLTVLVVWALALSIAAPSSADAPETLGSEWAVSGELTGNHGGAFAYYTIPYPGDGRVVTIEMRFHPGDLVTKIGVGFNVYGPNGYFIGQGLLVEDNGPDGVMQLKYSDTNPATWQIQVYNYLAKATIHYVVIAPEVPQAVAPPGEAAAAAIMASVEAEAAVPLMASRSLTGKAGGAYDTYEVTVPAGGPDIEVTMTWSPDNPIIAAGVGFVAYGWSGDVRTPTGTGQPGERKVTLPADASGTYEIQVYNYIHGLKIDYAIASAAVE